MIVEQIVEIPPNRQLLVKVPTEIPLGKAILTFTPAPVISGTNESDIKVKLQKLQGCLSNSAFYGLNGVEYQQKVREEWDN